MASGEPKSLRILSLDGGGVKGYTSLIILQRIFRTLQDIKPHEPPLKPCQVFDLIVGTSTGGLIAIMLGRLEMSIEEAIEQYEVVGRKVFGKRPFFGKFASAIFGAPFYDIRILQECVKDLLDTRNIPRDENFIVLDSTISCRVKVCVTSRFTSNVDALRNYRSVHPTITNYDCTIWEAASATAAAPVFFKHVKLRNGGEFYDGGLRRNNPVEEALSEWHRERDLKTRDLGCLISIGTGLHKIKGISPGLSRLLKASIRMMTDSQDIAERFLRTDEGELLQNSNRYFRFNVPQGMEDLKIDEYKETAKMKALTENYLQGVINGKIVAQCAEALAKSDELGNKAESFGENKLQHDEIECLNSLSFPGMDRWRHSSRGSSVDTRSWLFQHKTFQDWFHHRDIQTHNGLLWISGKPGSGKSTLMLKAYHHASRLQRSGGYCTAAFFFSTKSTSEQNGLLRNPEGLYRSLLHQLLPHHKYSLRKVVEARKYKLSCLGHGDGNVVPWSEEELRNHFSSLFEESSALHTIIFIDAMDECDESRVRELAFFFRELTKHANHGNRKLDVCLSSAHVAVVNLDNCPSIIVDENNGSDISHYLDKMLVTNDASSYQDIQRLRNKIIEMSSGVFLWVVLVVDLLLAELDRGRTIEYLETQRLPEVPRGLQDLFRNILGRIKDEDRETSLRFFQWAILAGELRLKEWRHIFPFIGHNKPKSFKEAMQSELYAKTDDQLEKQIRYISKGLFEVVGGRRPASLEGTNVDDDSIIGGAGSLDLETGDTRIVGVIHVSVREFFVHEGGFLILGPELGFNAIGKGYISIMNTCLDYIKIKELDDLERARLKVKPFAESCDGSSESSRGRGHSRGTSVSSFSSAGTMRFHRRRRLSSSSINTMNTSFSRDSRPKLRRTKLIWSALSAPNSQKSPTEEHPTAKEMQERRLSLLELEPSLKWQSPPPSDIPSDIDSRISTNFHRDTELPVDPVFLSYISATFATHAQSAEEEGADASEIIHRLRDKRMWRRWVLLTENIPDGTSLINWAEEWNLTSWVTPLSDIAGLLDGGLTTPSETLEEKLTLNYCLDYGRSLLGETKRNDAGFENPDSIVRLCSDSSSDNPDQYFGIVRERMRLFGSYTVSGDPFIPQYWLHRILTLHIVEKILQMIGHTANDTEKVYNSFRLILGILLMIEKPQAIKYFLWQNINDECLPLVSWKSSLIVLIRGERIAVHPSGWSNIDILSFYQQQWAFLVPFFARPRGEIHHYKLNNKDAILPITDVQDCPLYHRSISKVKLETASCESKDFPLQGKYGWYIMHQTGYWKTFLCETHTWKFLDTQRERNTNILPLLFTVETPMTYYHFFPWPSGCLYELFETSSGYSRNAAWVASQCWGISDSLAILHQKEVGGWHRSKRRFDTRPTFLQHGHITPCNILWFIGSEINPPHDEDILVLSNFPFSYRFNAANYMAPELEWRTRGRQYRIGRKADIWGLACIFIEILRWHIDPSNWLPITTELYQDEDIMNISNYNSPNPIRVIQQHENKTPYVSEFTEYIESKMLATDPRKRATALEVAHKMKELQEKLQNNHGYGEGTTSRRGIARQAVLGLFNKGIAKLQ
ncbi:hypothetical protein F5Y11DRAFT_363187 [Daldinia sp. FL1419]|nr:hypothetical protein F5Y11DRAFT_363187 [Daldinia sp. FL1419]